MRPPPACPPACLPVCQSVCKAPDRQVRHSDSVEQLSAYRPGASSLAMCQNITRHVCGWLMISTARRPPSCRHQWARALMRRPLATVSLGSGCWRERWLWPQVVQSRHLKRRRRRHGLSGSRRSRQGLARSFHARRLHLVCLLRASPVVGDDDGDGGSFARDDEDESRGPCGSSGGTRTEHHHDELWRAVCSHSLELGEATTATTALHRHRRQQCAHWLAEGILKRRE